MATPVEENTHRHIEATIKAIDARRANVLRLISQADPRMNDDEFRAARIASVEQAVLSALFERGNNKAPGVQAGADFLAWFVDRELWRRFEPVVKGPFPFEDRRPPLNSAPASAKFNKYKADLLAKEVADTARPTEGSHLLHIEGDKDEKKQTWRHTGVGASNKRQRVGVEEKTAVSAPAQQHESPIAMDTRGKQPARAEEAEDKHPKGNDAHVEKLRQKLVVLFATPFPDNTREWPRLVWESMYDNKPSAHGDYFALPIRDDWTPLVAPDVLARARGLIDPNICIAVREPAALGAPRMLTVSFSEDGAPTVPRSILVFIDVWSKVREWHRYMVEDLGQHPLDQFILALATHEAAIRMKQA